MNPIIRKILNRILRPAPLPQKTFIYDTVIDAATGDELPILRIFRNLIGNGKHVVVAAVPDRQIRVLYYLVHVSGYENVKVYWQNGDKPISSYKYFQSNTGVFGVYGVAPPGYWLMATGVGEPLCLNVSDDTEVCVDVMYVESRLPRVMQG